MPKEGMAGLSTLIGHLTDRGAHPQQTEQALCLVGIGLKQLQVGEPLVISTPTCQPRTSAMTRAGINA